MRPLIDPSFRFILCDPVSLLNPADQLVTFARDLINVIVRQVSPLFFDLPFQLFPLSRNFIPIHLCHPPFWFFYDNVLLAVTNFWSALGRGPLPFVLSDVEGEN